MKKLVLLAAVAAFATTMIGCGPAATSKPGTGSTTTSTEVKKDAK